ncbi:MAG: NB-ARC domain-containing protein, partial [Anaerolineae bacterium]
MELIFSLIPEDLKRQLFNGLVDFLVEQAKSRVSDELANRIRRLSSEGAFIRDFDRALKTATERFVAEYTPVDEDLVAAIAADPDFWKSPSVRKALIELVRRPGAWLPQQREQITHRFDDVLPQRINRERVDRAVNFLLRCLVEELWTLPGAKELREVYSLQFQRVTAEAAQEQVALIRRQLEALTTLSADVRLALGQLAEALARPLPAPAVPVLPARPRPYHNLPQPDYVRFVGREKELEWLRRRLSPQDRAWVMVITGIGGVGKSALALAIGHEYRRRYEELPPEERFEAIVWASAKERVLTAGGEERAAPEGRIFRTLGDIYRAIAQALEREDITRASAEEQDEIVQAALTRQRTLLILDNMEEVADEEVRAFVRNLPAPTKAIITTREWIPVGGDELRLMGMEWEEAEALMAAEAEARGVGLDEAQRRVLYQRTAGLPLPIRLSVARLASGETFEQVVRWLGDATGDLPRYCVGGQVDLAQQRDPNAGKLLLACSLFDREAGASREALGAVADLPRADRDDGLTLLQRLNLLNRTDKDRFWMLPIVQEYARA